jgi:hypothetical protein
MQAQPSSALNPHLPMLFRVIASVEWLVLGVTGFGLFLLPTVGSAQWPWQVKPFNTFFLAAVYISSFAAVTALLWGGRWAPARVGLWMLVFFTTLVLIISVLYLDRFDFHKWATWAWFFLYIVIPLNSAYNLYLYRRLQPVNPMPLPSLLKWYLLVQAVALTLYTLALLLAPVASTAFWPWHIDEFHGRMYSAIFLTGAVGAYVLWRSAAAIELLLLGVTQSVLGLFAILGVIIVNASQQTVNWTQPGTWIWIGLFAVLMLTGIVMIVLALGKLLVWQQGQKRWADGSASK